MMKYSFRTWLALLAALILSLSCALGETTETADPVLLATVNGEEITEDNADLQELVSYYSSYYASYGYDITDPDLQTIFKATGLDWAIECALYRQKAAEKGIEGLSDEEVASLKADALQEWEEAVAAVQEDVAPLSEDATEDEKAAARVSTLAYIEEYYGYTEDSYVQEYVDGYIQSEIRNKVAAAETGEITVSEQEIIDEFNETVETDRQTYEGNVFTYEYYTNYMGETSYYTPAGYRGITHILLDVDQDLMNTYTDLSARFEEQQASAESVEETAETVEETGEETADETAETAEGTLEEASEPFEEAVEETVEAVETVTQEMVDAAKQAILDSVQPTVDEIMDKFNAGTPFADLIEEYGTDPGMQVEPNKSQGYMVHADSILWDPAFIAGAMTLEKVGDVSEPVLGSYGVHILFYLRDVPAGAVDMTEEIRNELEAELLEQKESDANSAMIDRWMAESDIQYTEAGQKLKADADAAMTSQVDEYEEEDEEAFEFDIEDMADDEELEIEIEASGDEASEAAE